MRKKILFLTFVLGIAGTIFYLKSNEVNAATQIQESKEVEETFDIKIEIEKTDDKKYELSTTIELKDGNYIISPYSEDDIYLHYSITIPKNNNLIVDEKLIEIPASIPEIDPILNIPVRFVKETTTYKQEIEVTTEKDFEVSGLIEFLVEPSCIPYDVEFLISHQSGIMEVKKTKTAISKEYKL